MTLFSELTFGEIHCMGAKENSGWCQKMVISGYPELEQNAPKIHVKLACTGPLGCYRSLRYQPPNTVVLGPKVTKFG